MKIITSILLSSVLAMMTILCFYPVYANAAPINIVAAENVYGEVAQEIGGPNVRVVSILNNPTQDPHLFTLNPSDVRKGADADIIIYNGADYDPWIKTILNTKPTRERQVIVVADLIGTKAGSNPHIWFKPETVLVFANHLAALLSKKDPAHQADYLKRLETFKQNYQNIFTAIANLKKQFANTPVIATEPVFNDMADSIGFSMHGIGFQINIMNDVPPSISQIKQFEDLITQQKVKLLIYNTQTANPLTNHMVGVANDAHVPVFGVSEMMPNNTTYIKWMLNMLAQLKTALTHQDKSKK